MVTKDGISIVRKKWHGVGATVIFTGGDVSLTVTRNRNGGLGYLASMFSKGVEGKPCYLQIWTDRRCAKSIINSMKGG